MRKTCFAGILRRFALWFALMVCFASVSHAQSAPSDPDVSGKDAIEGEPVNIWDDFKVALVPWKGDYDGMVERKMIRIAVPYSPTH